MSSSILSVKWGFTIEEFNNALKDADTEGSKEWERTHENWKDHKDTDWPDEHEIGGEG